MNRLVLPLLLGLSLASVLCWAAEANADQAEVIAEIERLGGTVTVAENSPGKPVISVDLAHSRATTDATLARFKTLPHLRALNLSHTTVTDGGLAHIEGLKQLDALDLEYTKVTDTGLRHLNSLTKLRSLHLGIDKISDAGLENLSGLLQLESLDLKYTQINGKGLAHLKRLTQLSRWT